MGARFVEADYLDGDTMAAVFQNDLVGGADRSDIPEMRLADVNDDLLQRLGEIESGDEASVEAKKKSPSTI